MIPEYCRSFPADAPLGYAPAPGAHRVFHGAELARLAARYGIPPANFEDACFDRPVRPVDKEKLLDALRTSLAMPDARIELMESSLYPAPAGEMVFPRTSLGAPQNGVALWKGYVRYGLSRRFPVWARVKIQVRGSRVVAAEDLRAGAAIAASQVRLETAEGFPDPAPPAQFVEQVAGHVLRRGLRAGSVVTLEALDDVKEVARGDRVKVDVHSGAARLEFEARAESGGNSGETISVLNLKSGKKFEAQVSGKDKVSISQ